MSETAVETPAKAPKKEVVYTKVNMDDGRVVEFPGSRQVQKTSLVDLEAKTAAVRFDFVNGKTVTIGSAELTLETQLTALAHGLAQKVGDEWSGVKDIEEIVMTAESITKRLRTDGWTAPREAGDSMAGASVVIRALCEHSGKSQEAVKAFLDGKIEKAKAAGQKLSRQELYASFRAPNSPVAAIITRLEAEKASKGSKVNSADLLGELEAA